MSEEQQGQLPLPGRRLLVRKTPGAQPLNLCCIMRKIETLWSESQPRHQPRRLNSDFFFLTILEESFLLIWAGRVGGSSRKVAAIKSKKKHTQKGEGAISQIVLPNGLSLSQRILLIVIDLLLLCNGDCTIYSLSTVSDKKNET